jgi:hypothetical protein
MFRGIKVEKNVVFHIGFRNQSIPCSDMQPMQHAFASFLSLSIVYDRSMLWMLAVERL